MPMMLLLKPNLMLLKLRIGGIPHERHALVDLDDLVVQDRCALYVEGEDLGAGLVAYDEEVLKVE